jgi:hypothetical protein
MIFEFSKCSSDEMSSLPFPSRFRWKHMGEIKLLEDTSTKFLCGPRRFLLIHWLNSWFQLVHSLAPTSWFWPRVCAARTRLFWAHCYVQRGAAHRSFAAPPKIKNQLFSETKCFPSGPNSGRQGRIFFHWAKLHPTELHCSLLSYAAPYLVTLHPSELCCTLSELSCAIRATLELSELRFSRLSYAASFWAMLRPTELRLTLNELRGILKM